MPLSSFDPWMFLPPAVPDDLTEALRRVLAWLSPYGLILAGVGAALCLVFCFLGYRARRARHAIGMALLGAAAASLLLVSLVPDASPMLLVGVIAGSALVLGVLGAIFWRVGAVAGYAIGSFILLFCGLGTAIPNLMPAWLLVISILAAVGVAVLLACVMFHAEIVLSGLFGFGASVTGAALVFTLFPELLRRLVPAAPFWITVGVGVLLSAAGITVQYLTTRRLRPLKGMEKRQFADAKAAIRAAAAITFEDGIAPAEAAEKQPLPETAAPESPAGEASDRASAETAEISVEAETSPEESPAKDTPEESPAADGSEHPAAEIPAPEGAAVPEEAPAPEAAAAGKTVPQQATPDVVCPVCAGWNEAGSRFCSWCGVKL